MSRTYLAHHELESVITTTITTIIIIIIIIINNININHAGWQQLGRQWMHGWMVTWMNRRLIDCMHDL